MRNRKFWNGTVYQGLLCCDWGWMKMGVYYLCTVNVVQVCHVRILHTYMYNRTLILT
jgi:hypothetical protein